jgi:aminoglycoside phosphotransferase family enzyme
LPRFDQALAQASPALGQRVAGGHIRDGHGDLRPEHIALTDPPVVIDALEFNAALRAQDPYDELAFLDLECARLGAPGLGPALIQGVSAALGERPPHHLLPLYRAHRALLRARLALAHLLEDPVRHPDRWPPRAAGYLQQAEQALDTLEDTGTAA